MWLLRFGQTVCTVQIPIHSAFCFLFSFSSSFGPLFLPSLFVHRILEIWDLTWLSLAARRVIVEAFRSHCC